MSTKSLVAGAGALVVLVTLVLANVGGTSAAFSDAATVSAAPSAGSIAAPALVVSQTVNANGEVTLSWARTSVGSSTATASRYEVFSQSSEASRDGTQVCSVTTPGCTVTAPSVKVWYVLRAHFATNWFRDSPPVSFTPVPPKAPTDVRCVRSGILGLNSYLAWTAPAGAVDSYVVSWTRGSATDNEPVGTATTWQPGNRLAAGAYVVMVSSVKNGLMSPASTTSGTITKQFFGLTC